MLSGHVSAVLLGHDSAVLPTHDSAVLPGHVSRKHRSADSISNSYKNAAMNTELAVRYQTAAVLMSGTTFYGARICSTIEHFIQSSCV